MNKNKKEEKNRSSNGWLDPYLAIKRFLYLVIQYTTNSHAVGLRVRGCGAISLWRRCYERSGFIYIGHNAVKIGSKNCGTWTH